MARAKIQIGEERQAEAEVWRQKIKRKKEYLR